MRNIIYQFKMILRVKSFVFWILLFPLILASFFNLAFSNIGEETMDPIPVGIDENNLNIKIFEALDILDIVPLSQAEAKDRILSNEIIAYINEDNSILLGTNGSRENIVKSIVDQVVQSGKLLRANSPEDEARIVEKMGDFSLKNYVENQPGSSSSFNFISLIYYNLIALASTYGTYAALEFVSIYNGNLSHVGGRLNITPINKFKLLFSGVLVSVGINLLANLLLLFYLEGVLAMGLIKNFSSSLGLILIGNIYGVALGLGIGSIKTLTYNKKNIILILINLILSTLSGLMNPAIKNFIDEKIPFINKISPISNITSGLYRFNALGAGAAIYSEMLALVLISLGLLGFAYYNLRGEGYDSI